MCTALNAQEFEEDCSKKYEQGFKMCSERGENIRESPRQLKAGGT